MDRLWPGYSLLKQSLYLSFLIVIIVSILIPSSVFSQNEYVGTMYSWMRSISLPALAVSSGGGGVVSNLTITLAYPGRGELYFSSEPLTMIDSQASARIAFRVAAELAGYNYKNYDAFVSLKSPSLVIGGPSAGAVMTIGFLALFTGASVNESVAMTGMVYPDGTIGPVGGVKDKMEAAAEAGYSVFLVPAGESVVMVENVTRTERGVFVVRQPLNLTEYGKKLGIQVIEVASIREAAKYFLNGWNTMVQTPGIPSYSDEAKRLFQSWIIEMNTTRSELLALANLSVAGKLVNESNTYYKKALDFMGKEKYYIAASFMFTSAAFAEAAYIKTVIKTPEQLTSYVNEINSTIGAITETLSAIKPANISSLEAIVTARQRIIDAQELLNKALNNIYAISNPLTGETQLFIDDNAALSLAYAKWRTIAARNWIGYSQIPSPSITAKDLSRVTNDFMGLASTVVSYYNSLLQDLGATLAETPSLKYQIGVKTLSEGDTVGALSYFMQSLAESMVGLHRIFDYQPRKIAENLKDMLVERLSQGDYVSVIALGYLEYGIEDLDNYDKTGDEAALFSSIRLFTLGSLQTALIRYLSPPSSQTPHSDGVVKQTPVTRTLTITVTRTVTPIDNQARGQENVTETVTVTNTKNIGSTPGTFLYFTIALVLLTAVSSYLLGRRSAFN